MPCCPIAMHVEVVRGAFRLTITPRGLKMIKLAARSLLVLSMSLSAFGVAMADDKVTKEDAVAMVKKGIEFINANGAEKGYAEISNKQGQFIKGDLYLVVYDMTGKCLAHGSNPKQIGKDLINLTDVDGNYFIKERVELAKKSPKGFWQDYKFANPVSKKIEPKQMYCEKAGDTAICGGIYK